MVVQESDIQVTLELEAKRKRRLSLLFPSKRPSPGPHPFEKPNSSGILTRDSELHTGKDRLPTLLTRYSMRTNHSRAPIRQNGRGDYIDEDGNPVKLER